MKPHHRFMLTEQLDHIDRLDKAIKRVGAEIETRMGPLLPPEPEQTSGKQSPSEQAPSEQEPQAVQTASDKPTEPANKESLSLAQAGILHGTNEPLKASWPSLAGIWIGLEVLNIWRHGPGCVRAITKVRANAPVAEPTQAALLTRAQLVLGVDNGPLHLATAQGTPTLRLFGPTDTHIFGPWGPPERHVVIASNQKCPTCPAIPCGRLDFRPNELPSHPCVRVITEEQVERAIIKTARNECRLV